jgi:hypothetical protein
MLEAAADEVSYLRIRKEAFLNRLEREPATMEKRYGIRRDLIKKSHIDDHSSDELTSDPGNEDSQELYGKFLKTLKLIPLLLRNLRNSRGFNFINLINL